MRLVGERKALAAAGTALFTVMYAINAVFGPPEFTLMFTGLAAVYGLAFFGLVAGWFWARWFAMGVGFSGLVIAAIVAVQLGLDPAVFVIGVPHGLVVVSLLGRGMASAFEGRSEWRERFRMDENAVHRLGRAVTRAGASLPYLIMAGLGPRSGGLGLVLGLGALALGVWGLRGLVRQRTWGVLALGAAGLVAAVQVAVDLGSPAACGGAALALGVALPIWVPALFSSVFTLLASGAYVRPLLRALRQ